ncbi:hypothetical protein EDB19DRAFT_1912907 [Suillus lakei]|nr:hypothetical protein EDB19DRAFT_1912907 [Suillus lakei]
MPSSPTNEPQFQTVLGRGHHTKNTARLTKSITAELASEGSPNVPATKSKPRRTKKSNANDASTQSQIDLLKNDLHALYKEDYATTSVAQDSVSSLSASTGHHANVSDGRNSPSKVNFMVRYKKQSNVLVDEFEEYLKLPQEDFDLCDPIQWWAV